MADVELLPLPWTLCHFHDDTQEAIRANVAHATAAQAAEIEALRAEVERLRADRDSWEQQSSDRVADWHAENLRAERLAEALRVAAGELASIGDAIGHDHPEARRIFTLRANLLSARLAALAQEDRNG